MQFMAHIIFSCNLWHISYSLTFSKTCNKLSHYSIKAHHIHWHPLIANRLKGEESTEHTYHHMCLNAHSHFFVLNLMLLIVFITTVMDKCKFRHVCFVTRYYPWIIQGTHKLLGNLNVLKIIGSDQPLLVSNSRWLYIMLFKVRFNWWRK